jgi:hypothetical protein
VTSPNDPSSAHETLFRAYLYAPRLSSQVLQIGFAGLGEALPLIDTGQIADWRLAVLRLLLRF